MKRRLAKQELIYLLEHLELFHPGSGLAASLNYGSLDGADLAPGKPGASEIKLVFPPSDDPLETDRVIFIGELPVLFPCSEHKQWYTVEERQVRFHHDILKSAFYLLSAYQEFESREKDEHGRFPWRSSIQFQLGITQKPVVNYYFSIILEALEKCLEARGLKPLMKKESPPVLFLSHDVDRIVKYSLRDVAYWVLSVAGLKPSALSLSKRWRNLLVCARGTFLSRKDPYWNFQELLELEASLGIFSTWYMLEKTPLENSRYHFHSKKIQKLIASIEGRGHEIGIHGTLESSDELQAMKDGIRRLEAVSLHPVIGVRQHYLRYSNPHTTRIHEACGLGYDSTLGFAEQTGFRNSCALPFRLYDFERQRPFGLWQIPLVLMDVTLTGYMSTRVRDIPASIQPLVEEVKKFSGILGMLWHNCHLDDEEYPGINEMYARLLTSIMESGFVSRSGKQLLEGLKSSGA